MTDTRPGTLVICRVCRVVLSRFDNHVEETVSWLHSQSWREYDHEPVPTVVPLSRSGAADLVCDFCGESGVRWHYLGENVILRVGTTDSPLGTRWAGCDACDALIRRRDIDGLVARHFAAAAYADGQRAFAERIGGQVGEAQRLDLIRAHTDMVTAYARSIYRRALIPPAPPPPTKITAARLPKVRDRLARYWRELGADGLGQFIALATDAPPLDEYAERFARATEAAELYWVSKQFSVLVGDAARALPDLSVARADVPAVCGLVVYDDPVFEVVLSDGLPSLIVAIGWTLVPGGLSLVAYAQPEQVFGDADREQLRADYGYLLPAVVGARLVFQAGPDREQGHQPWSILLATWFLMAQPGVASAETVRPEKSYARSYARAHPGTQVPAVRLIDLRRRAGTASAPAGGEPGRKWSVRVLVGGKTGGFWRDQVHGPGRSLRKRIFIAPYLAGPDNAPLRELTPAETVRVLR